METDREMLIWFHQRLVKQHKESHLFDYMHRLRWIIAATPPGRTSRGKNIQACCNNTKDLLKLLKKPSKFEVQMLSEE
jgi:hypothetical protein